MTILSESTHYAVNKIGIILIVIISVLALIAAFASIIDDMPKLCICFIIASIALVIVVIIFFNNPYHKLKVTLPDDYPAVTLHENYDVIDRDGDIWIIQEKEPIKEQKNGRT